MKFLLCLFLFVLPVTAQKLSTDYDKFKNLTRVSGKSWEYVNADKGRPLRVNLYVFFKGEKQTGEADAAMLVFRSASSDWEYLKNNLLIILVDGARLDIGRAIRDSSIGKNGVTETLMYAMPFADAQRLADASKVEVQIGRFEGTFTNDAHKMVRAVVKAVQH